MSRSGSGLESTKTNQSPPSQDALPPLLRLPGEVRNQIWMLCLVRDKAISIGSHWEAYYGKLATKTPSAAAPVAKNNALRAFQTSRQIHDEASSIFYGENTFALLCYTAAPFLSSLRSTYHRHIRSLALSDTAANIVVREIVRYWPPELDRIDIWVDPRAVKARGPEQCASEIAQKVLRVVKAARHHESPSLESILKCFELFQMQYIAIIPGFEGMIVCTDEELDAVFQEKLRELLVSDC